MDWQLGVGVVREACDQVIGYKLEFETMELNTKTDMAGTINIEPIL